MCMKIAIVSPMVVGYGMSPETYSSQQVNLALRWAEAGHKVDLLTLRGQGLESTPLHSHITVRLCPGVMLSKRGLPLMYGVRDAMQGQDYDFVLASEHYQPATAMACMASSRVLIYQALNSAGNSLRGRIVFGIMEAIFGRISRERCIGVVAKTNQAAHFVEARGFSPVEVIPCGYDETRFFPPAPDERERCRASLGLASDEHVLVYAGNLIQRRDVGSAIEALAILKQKGNNVRLLVAGKGPQLQALERQTIELGAEAEVLFLGLLPWMRLREIYWAGDVFVFPARNEGFGLVLLEAMACGMLVVSTPVGAAKNIISDGENGFIIPIGHPQAIADILEKGIDNPEAVAGLEERASRDIRNYTWQAIAQRIVSFAQALSA